MPRPGCPAARPAENATLAALQWPPQPEGADPIDDAGTLTERPLGAIAKKPLGNRKVDRVLRDAQSFKSETCS